MGNHNDGNGKGEIFDLIKDAIDKGDICTRLASWEGSEIPPANGDIARWKLLDMEVSYYANLGSNKYTRITRTLLSMLGVTEAEIRNNARDYIRRHVRVESMEDMLGIGGPGFIYVGTTDNNMFGAAVLAYGEFLDMLCERAESRRIIIFPSSIHEVIAIPESMWDDGMAGMTAEINASVVDEASRLTDSIYEYDADKKELVIFANPQFEDKNIRKTLQTVVF